MRLPAVRVASDLSCLLLSSSVRLVPSEVTQSCAPRFLAGWAQGDSDQAQKSVGVMHGWEGEPGTP